MTLAGPALVAVVDHLRDELSEIESIFAGCIGDRSVARYRVPYVPSEDGCLIALYDAWVRFMRELLLTSCSGPVLGLAGHTHIPATARNSQTAIDHLRRNRRGTKISFLGGEPKWADAAAVSDLTTVLGLANGGTIVSAVTASAVTLGVTTVPNPLEQIRACRNYVSHKGPTAMAQVRVAIAGQFSDMTSVLRRRHLGVEIFSEWIESCLALAEVAAQ